MQSKSVNDVLADNLRQFMRDKGLTQKALEKSSGVAQTTISLYLNPENRKPSSSGNPPSGKLSEVEALARSMDLEFWELVLPMNAAQRELLKKFWSMVKDASPQIEPNAQEPGPGNRKQKARMKSPANVYHLPRFTKSTRKGGVAGSAKILIFARERARDV